MSKSQLLVFDDPISLSRAAAEYIGTLTREPIADGHPFTMAVSGGRTPERLYRLLGQPPYSLTIPWPRLHIFWGDERCVPPDHAESNFRQANELWLENVPLPAANVHRIRGELGAAAAARDYATQLHDHARATLADPQQRWPRFDLVLLGLGDDGHVAALFPGSIPATGQPVLAVTADYQGRPAERVTLAPVVFNNARTVLFLVTGESKAEALAAVRQGRPDPTRWPASRIQPEDGLVLWLVDRAAAHKLK